MGYPQPLADAADYPPILGLSHSRAPSTSPLAHATTYSCPHSLAHPPELPSPTGTPTRARTHTRLHANLPILPSPPRPYSPLVALLPLELPHPLTAPLQTPLTRTHAHT